MDMKSGVLRRAGAWDGAAAGDVRLDYEGRFLRRRRLVTTHGAGLLVDLPETISVEHGDAFELDDGRLIAVVAAPEPLLKITGDLVRLAWHIGNRHTPCQVMGDHLLIRDDHVLKAMLVQLGAEVVAIDAPFRPEGGAYGHGRTMGHSHGGHSHGPEDHHDHHHDHVDHSHVNSNGHDHGHAHSDLNSARATQQGDHG